MKILVLKLNINQIRTDFPILGRKVNDKPLIYFDNAATTQKPYQVIKVLEKYYKKHNSNVHRGNHFLSIKATDKFEGAREKIRAFINAPEKEGVIFTRGTTESINLVASSFGRKYLQEGDEVLITEMEHHSNIVPWQLICEERKAVLKVAPINDSGELELDKLKELIGPKTKILAVTHVSNTLGTINPVKEIIRYAQNNNVAVLLDGAQAAPHLKVDVQELGCDFYCFSGHKVYGPTGIGVLYMKSKWLDVLPPYQGGGEMIESVSFEKTTFNEAPYKFEAGTPNIAAAIAMGTALEYIDNIGLDIVALHEKELLDYATEQMLKLDGLKVYGNSNHKASVISFMIEGMHPGDIGTLLDKMGVAVRVGNHCTEPIMTKFGLPGTIRASFAFYNIQEEIDLFVHALRKAILMLS